MKYDTYIHLQETLTALMYFTMQAGDKDGCAALTECKQLLMKRMGFRDGYGECEDECIGEETVAPEPMPREDR
jgi:hypothetical protein